MDEKCRSPRNERIHKRINSSVRAAICVTRMFLWLDVVESVSYSNGAYLVYCIDEKAKALFLVRASVLHLETHLD
jgi:hypothetical protein